MTIATEDERDRVLRQLVADGVVERGDAGELRTTRRWQGAMARAALRLYDKGDPGDDLRVPIALAMLDVCGASASDEELAARVDAMLPIEAQSLGLTRSPTS